MDDALLVELFQHHNYVGCIKGHLHLTEIAILLALLGEKLITMAQEVGAEEVGKVAARTIFHHEEQKILVLEGVFQLDEMLAARQVVADLALGEGLLDLVVFLQLRFLEHFDCVKLLRVCLKACEEHNSIGSLA
jgi:hypothetical protein